MNWGGKKTEIKVKLYNKSRELGILDGGEPEKPWIVNEWNRAGIDTKTAWRLEFSLKSSGQLRWNDETIKLHYLASPMWLYDVYTNLYSKRFVTRINQGKKDGHKNNDKRVYLINLPEGNGKLSWAETTEHTCEAEPAVQLLRSMMRTLDNEALKADKRLFESYTMNICDVVQTHGLDDYFQRCFHKPAIQFMAELTDHMGSGINEHSVDISKLID